MSFTVEPAIWDQFPGMVLAVARADGIDNRAVNEQLTRDTARLREETRRGWSYENAQSHPRIAAWRTAMREALGLSSRDYQSSVESLVRRVIRGKEITSISPLVDFYNLVSVRHLVPAGGWDVDGLAGGAIALRRTTAGDTFVALGTTERIAVEAGEVCYADVEELVTRHFVWRQAERGKVSPATSSVFLVSEVLPEAGTETAEAVRSAFADGLRSYFGVEARTAVLGKGDERWSWE
jgi:DNA/RNA-binding domain of Phe-tRNA-synthetase-like protein